MDDMTVEAQLAFPLNVKHRGEIAVYEFSLPFLPPSKNQFDGWPNEWKWSAKKKWIRHLLSEFEMSELPKDARRVGLGATLVFPTVRQRDTQNYANCLWNWVPDALVKYGAIKDDTPEHVQFGQNLGIRFATDLRRLSEVQRKRTHLAVTMEMH